MAAVAIVSSVSLGLRLVGIPLLIISGIAVARYAIAVYRVKRNRA